MSRSVEQLVVFGSTITALALARNAWLLGMPCTLIDTKEGVATSTRTAKVIVLPSASDERMVEQLVALANDKPSALVVDSDAGLRVLAAHRQALQNSFQKILHPDNEALRICLDKCQFLSWCEAAGLPAPKLYPVREAYEQAEWRFPLMVRPTITRHGMQNELPKAREVAGWDEFRSLLAMYELYGADACICDSLLRDDTRQFSVGVVRNEVGNTRALVAEKKRPSARFCGGGTYVVTAPEEAVAELALSAISALNYFGIAEVEILQFQTTKEMFIVEINPRPWVQYALTWRSGFDFLAFLIAPTLYDSTRERKAGGRWLSWVDDLYVSFSRSEGMVKRQELPLSEYFRSLLTANVFPVWSIFDPNPSIKGIGRRVFARQNRSGGD